MQCDKGVGIMMMNFDDYVILKSNSAEESIYIEVQFHTREENLTYTTDRRNLYQH